MKPQIGTYPTYFDRYFNHIKLDNVIETLIENINFVEKFVSTIPSEKSDFAYAEGKWSVKQVLQHVIDCERILTYRALHIARRDENALLAFNENHYANVADVSKFSLQNILTDFVSARNNTISLFSTFSESDLQVVGNTGMGNNTALAIGYFLPGHAVHHLKVITEKYLIN